MWVNRYPSRSHPEIHMPCQTYVRHKILRLCCLILGPFGKCHSNQTVHPCGGGRRLSRFLPWVSVVIVSVFGQKCPIDNRFSWWVVSGSSRWQLSSSSYRHPSTSICSFGWKNKKHFPLPVVRLYEDDGRNGNNSVLFPWEEEDSDQNWYVLDSASVRGQYGFMDV